MNVHLLEIILNTLYSIFSIIFFKHLEKSSVLFVLLLIIINKSSDIIGLNN